jgi:hypothetical protein
VNLLEAAARAAAHRAQASAAPVDFRYEVTVAGGAVVAFNPENTDVDEVRWARRYESGAASLEAVGGALQRYADLAGGIGARPLLVYLPSAHTAYADSVRFRDPALAAPLAAFSAAQRAYLGRRARELGLGFADVTGPLQEAAREGGDLLYFPSTLHLTPAGHGVVARAVAAAVDAGHRTEL